MSLPDLDRARNLLAGVEGRGVLVLGDLILDSYLWGSVSRISPEAPVPVVRLERESERLGGAGNVARNLAALGAKVGIVGVVGEDAAGDRVLELLRGAGVDTEGMVRAPGRMTTRKTRVVAHQQQVVRVDREASEPLGAGVMEALEANLRAAMEGCEVVLVEDYEKGVVEEPLMEVLRELGCEAGIAFYVDPKGRPPGLYRGARCLTPNREEAALLSGRRIDDDEGLDLAARRVLEETSSEALLVTRGERGMVLYCSQGRREEIPALAREVYDVTGAGDTVAAVLAGVAGVDGSLSEAACLASCAAAVVVGRLGTVAPRSEEILEALRTMGGGR